MGKCINCYNYNENDDYCEVLDNEKAELYLTNVMGENDCKDYEGDMYRHLGLEKPY
jgi:hypothetical protein